MIDPVYRRAPVDLQILRAAWLKADDPSKATRLRFMVWSRRAQLIAMRRAGPDRPGECGSAVPER